MFDTTSRYFNLQTKKLVIIDTDDEIKEIRYIRRRFLSPAVEMTVLAEHTVTQDDRIDNITAVYMGDPTQFWRICDANEVFKPTELTDEIGRVMKISAPNI
jgi:hypothetical protein